MERTLLIDPHPPFLEPLRYFPFLIPDLRVAVSLPPAPHPAIDLGHAIEE